jgi:hypothetical protein
MRVLSLGLACAALVAAAPNSEPTFYKDVLPILQKNCQNCHRPGEAGPMSFMSYETTRPAAKAIKAAVLSKQMPPWFADPHVGKFENDRTLGAADIKTLVAWVDAGAKAGNAKEAPKPVEFQEGWAIGKPDVVLQVTEPIEIPASGTIDYTYVRIPTNFTEDKYVQFAEARPSDRVHVHHIIAYIRDPHSPFMKDAPIGKAFIPSRDMPRNAENRGGGGEGGGGNAGGIGDFLAGYAPGTVPELLKPGQAKFVPKGADIVLQLHYTADGKVGSDMSRVGMIFAKEPPKERVMTLAATTSKFEIPAGDANYRVDSSFTVQADATLTMMLPHMHLRGKDMTFTAVFPDGHKELLLDVPHYSFSWQLSYYLDKPLLLPKGTVIECTAHYDNSANNKYNPDPTKNIRFGEQSWDEMMFGFFEVAIPAAMNPMDVMRPPKAQQKTSGAAQQ